MVGKPGKTLVHRTLRIGEGHAVDVAILPATKGAATQYRIDTSSLPVPDRKLTSDAVGLIRGDYMVKLLFAQREANDDGFLSLLTVQMSFDSVHSFLRTMVPLEDGLEAFNKIPVGKLSVIKGRVQQSAAVSASIVLAGYTGTDGCLDFYYTSPFSVQSISFGNKLAVEPVVRVNIPTPLLIAMSRGLREIAPDLPSLSEEVRHV